MAMFSLPTPTSFRKAGRAAFVRNRIDKKLGVFGFAPTAVNILGGFGLALLAASFFGGCGDEGGAGGEASGGASGPAIIVEMRISNRSQFDLHHVFVHYPNQNYKETKSLIDSKLEEEQSLLHKVAVGKYRVTVTRLKNKDGPLWAFTTRDPIDIRSPILLEYFDTEFRLAPLSNSNGAVDPTEMNPVAAGRRFE